MHLEIKFCKKDDLRYISHLDIVRLFQRAIRRAELPVALSQGYTPHYRVRFFNALKLGIESDNEGAIIILNKWIEPDEFIWRLNEKLPEGFKVLECKKKFL